jgi:hypothetical protein
MALTTEQIHAAADGLAAAGQAPTLAAVRQALNGGSFTTISQAMSSWKAKQAEKAAPMRDPLPQTLADLLGKVGAEIWAEALALANGRLSNERAALEQARQAVEQEKAEAAELADQFSAELEAQKARSVSQEEALQTARMELVNKTAEAAELAQKLSATSARLEEVNKRADQLNAELERVNAQNAQLIGLAVPAAQVAAPSTPEPAPVAKPLAKTTKPAAKKVSK